MNIDRKEADPSLRWDLTAIYATEEAFTADLAALGEEVAAFPAHKETMTRSGEELYAALAADVAMGRRLSRLYEYAMLSSDLDKGDNGALARLGRVEDAENAYRAATYFLPTLIQSVGEEALSEFFVTCPRLGEFKRTIELCRRELPHMLSEEGERLLAELSPALGTQRETHSVFANADLDFGKVGIMICFDNYFPEVARILGIKGAELVLYPLYGGSFAGHAITEILLGERYPSGHLQDTLAREIS